jgi:hypothetical protein
MMAGSDRQLANIKHTLHLVVVESDNHQSTMCTRTTDRIFDMLEGRCTFDTLTELCIEVRSLFTHFITIPMFPDLKHLHFMMRGVPACILRRRHETTPVRHQIELPRLKHLVIDTNGIRKVLFGKLPSITVLMMCCTSVGSITEYGSTLHCALVGTLALFTDFQAVTKNLTEVEISVKLNWLCNLGTVCFPAATKLFIQAAGHYHASSLLPMVRIDAPLFETGRFHLADTCCIDFANSMFQSTIKHLTIMTPGLAAPPSMTS